MAFVHLHNHTEYSLARRLTHIKDMVRRAAGLDMPAVAVTDHGSHVRHGGTVRCLRRHREGDGKRVTHFGCEVYFHPDEAPCART